MSSVIKGARYVPDAVVLNRGRSRGFNLGSFVPRHGDQPLLVDAATAERERLETAKLQAERLVSEAEAKASEIVRESMVKGYEEGFAEGVQRAEDQCLEMVQQLTQLIQNALVDHDSTVRSAQREAAALALAVARKIVNREIALNEDAVLDIVRGALERIPPAERVRVLVNPQDEAIVRQRWGEVAGSAARGVEWELAPDPTIGRGGCVIEARSGFVDARIETQVAKLMEAFEADL